MAEKQKLVKITKHDGSVHFAPTTAKRKLDQQNNLYQAGKKMRIEVVEMTDEEVAEHPSHDRTYIPAGENNKVAMLKKLAASKESENEELKNQIAELLKNQGKSGGPLKAAEMISMIEKADSEIEVTEILGDDTRVSVTNAAAKRIKELGESQL